ncbi:MAG TPA: hypothetical protein VFF75_04400, partial [Methylophilaceae bacterium]|nr:hypothetical protein [Methylophilaceae bacterium]
MYSISYPSGTVRKDGVIIPQDRDTPELAAYLDWLKAGNGPEVLQDAEPLYPRIEVSAWQIRKALNRTGLRDAVETEVAASNDLDLKDGWERAPTFWSDQPMTL